MRTQPVGTTDIDAGGGATAVAPAPYPEDERRHRSAGPFDAEPTALRRTLSTLRDPTGWRVRTKLIAILVVPVIAILVFAGNGAASLLTSTRDVNRIDRLDNLSQQALTLSLALAYERTYTVGAIAAADAKNSGVTSASSSTGTDTSVIKQRRADVDRLIGPFEAKLRADEGSLSPAARAIALSAQDRLDRLSGLRAAVLTMRSMDSAQQAYTTVIDGLTNLIGEIPQGNDDRTLNASVQAASALAQGGELVAQEWSQIYGQLQAQAANPTGVTFTAANFRAFLSLDTQKDNAFGIFQDAATPSQTDQYRALLANDDVALSSDYIEAVLTAPTGQPLPTSVPADKWAQSMHVYVQQVDNLASDVLLQASHGRIDQLRSNLQRRALITSLLIVLVLGAALITAVIVARSLVRPLFALRGAALDVAGRRLPEAVRRLRDSTDQRIDADIESVGIDTDEEIGEVARAFDEVHREAVRLASEQAVLRNNVNAMFVNLSRRSQGLVERQLRLIDDLENREQDPDQLSNLFKLDHLATRMRRNNESLLVLAGTDTARRWSHPVPINEVVLAAVSEVEQYTRVKQTGAASLSIAGHAVSDVVHLIAELLENATAYSPPATEVSVMSHSLGPGAGAMIEIVDHGIGMPAKDLERVNERLASPPVIDVTVSRTMGLFAVGRLAGRHGIRAQLRESDTGGITALVRLPARVVTGEDPADGHELENETTVNTRALPRGNAPDLGRPALGAGDSGAFPLVGAGTNGNGAGYGASLNGNHGPDQDDDLADLGEITANSFLDADADETAGRRDDRGAFEPFNGGDRDDDRRRPNPAPARSSFEPRTAEDPPTGPVRPFTGPQRIPSDDDLAGAAGSRNGYLSNGFGPNGYSPDVREAQPGPDAPPLPRRDLGGRYQGPSDRPNQGYTEPDPSMTGPIVTGPSFVPGTDRTDYTGSDLTGPIPTGTGPQFRDPSFTDPNFSGPNFTGADYPDPNFTDPNLVRRDDTGPIGQAPAGRTAQQPTHESEPADGDAGPEETDATPIFDSVSAWFQRRTPNDPPAQVGAVAEPPAAPARQPAPPSAPPTPKPTPAPAQSNRPGIPPVRRPGVPQTASSAGGVPSSFGSVPDAGRSTNGGYAGRPAPERAPAPTPQPAVAAATSEPSWSSAADEGWRAAEAAREAANAGTTRSGLPIRTPKANLVPGTAEATPRRPAADPTSRSPEAVGGRLASFYQGVRQARESGTDNDGGRDARENM